MVATTPSTILLKGEPTRYEREADGTISPGMMVQLDSDGKVTVHASAEGPTARWFAVENDIAGDDLDHDYLVGEVVQIHAAKTGDEMYLYVDAGENVAIGDFLESDAAGKLKKYVADSAGVAENPGAIVAMAVAALNLSASAAVATRVKCVIT